jgi:hypothetical protein
MRMIRNWYPLLEGSGLTAHDLGPGNADGTLTDNVIWLPKGVTIAASVSRIVSAAAAGFNNAEGSIETLVKPSWNNDDGKNHTLWCTYGGYDRIFSLLKTVDGFTRLVTSNAIRGSFVYDWTADTPYHIVLNWGKNELYINKVLENDYDDGGLGNGASNLYIGDYQTGVNVAWQGDIYYFITRDVPLTQEEVITFYDFFTKQYL